jgi:ATP/maltotriose-dependent transcriptional regulator MalT
MVLYWASSGYFGEGLDWVERGLAMNGKLDPEAYLRAVSRAGYLAKFKGDEAKTRAYLEEALVLAESSTDVRERCEIYDNVSDFAHDNGDYDRARALQQRLVDESRELPDQSLHAIGLSGLGITCLATGDLAGDREYQERAYEIACSADDARRRARIAINLGVVYRYLNDLEMAEARYLEAERLYGDIGELNMMQATALNRSELALTMNQLERCQELSREIIAGAREIGNLRRETIATANLGLASIQLGQDREGFEILAKASSMALRQGAKPLIVEFLNAAAAEFTERGEMQRAATIFGSAASVARELGFVVSDEAQAMVRQAVRTCQAALGAEAFEKATARGAQMPLEDVVRLSEGPFRDAASDAPVDPASLGAITARERDVLRLLAEGLTDQQIADQLFLSKRTVSTHVASILAKLDVDSRTAAASAAIRNGLIA